MNKTFIAVVALFSALVAVPAVAALSSQPSTAMIAFKSERHASSHVVAPKSASTTIQLAEVVIAARPAVKAAKTASRAWVCSSRALLAGYEARSSAPSTVRTCGWEG
jgi:uncharacterized lipoprotein YbaY